MPANNFKYQPEELSAFAISFGMFIISLKNGEIVKHEPEDIMSFHNWLVDNEVRYLALRN